MIIHISSNMYFCERAKLVKLGSSALTVVGAAHNLSECWNTQTFGSFGGEEGSLNHPSAIFWDGFLIAKRSMEELENIESGIFMIMGIHSLLEELMLSKISNKYFGRLYWIMDIEYTQLSKVRFVVQRPVVDIKASPLPFSLSIWR